MPHVVAAVADPDRKYANIAKRQFGDEQAQVFSDGETLLRETSLDAIVITSPNHVHRGPAVLAMEKGVHVLLEKPVAASPQDMGAMWRAGRASGARPVVGFCLRYTPFYEAVHQLVTSGRIGKVLVINAEELMSDDLSMLFARGDWRPDRRKSGGLMLEKCSHDMDILNWIAGSRPQRVSSFASRTLLTPLPGAGARCRECDLVKTCRFAHGKVPEVYEAHWPPELHEVLDKVDDDACVFGEAQTYPDHQVVNVQYENGVLCNFTVAQCQPACRRTIHVLGSEGRIYGVVNENLIKVYRHGTASAGAEVVETIEVHPDASGHNGGDSVLTRDFFALLEGRPNRNRPGIEEGIEASLLSLAADESVEAGRPVSLDHWRRQVFDPEGGNGAAYPERVRVPALNHAR